MRGGAGTVVCWNGSVLVDAVPVGGPSGKRGNRIGRGVVDVCAEARAIQV